jgi:hypothetical protein
VIPTLDDRCPPTLPPAGDGRPIAEALKQVLIDQDFARDPQALEELAHAGPANGDV